jgi:hypothetical protein
MKPEFPHKGAADKEVIDSLRLLVTHRAALRMREASACQQSCSKEKLPLCTGGDFNIIRNSSEKNNNRFEERWPFLFDVVIDSLDLREIELSGRKFT